MVEGSGRREQMGMEKRSMNKWKKAKRTGREGRCEGM